MRGTTGLNRTVLRLLTATVTAATLVGCDGALTLLPFGGITAVQLFDEPNFTVALSVDSVVTDPSAIAKVNWVFGDGGGFVEGPAGRGSITHQYATAGDYEVTAFIFDADGFVDQITTMITVLPNGGTPPGPVPTPGDLPGAASNPSPADAAADVSVDTKLTWQAGLDADSHDVYLGKVQADVENADTSSTALFKGNQAGTEFDPGGLDPDTEYFWRIDEVNTAGTTQGAVFSFKTAKTPEKATDPIPAQGSTSVRVDGTLQWIAGDRATGHDVFFGTDLTAVTNATTDDVDVFQGNQTATTFDPEDAAATLSGQLLADTMYYWRIDEVGDGGTTTGDVWSFRTAMAPPKVFNPTPADGATGQDIDQALAWEAAASIESYDVYFGIDPVDLANATISGPDFRGNQTGKTFDPGLLAGGTTYYWRIDTLGPGGTTQGDVFSFTTIAPPGQVVGPFVPADDATNVDIGETLSWNAGAGGPTTSFQVFLSKNETAVVTGQSSALLTTQDEALTTFDLNDTLDPASVYYWRVDAIGPGGTTSGAVLSFTTGGIPDKAKDPDPLNGARGVALMPTLAWETALGGALPPNVNNYFVYFGDSQSAVQNAVDGSAELKAIVSVTNYPLATELDGNKDYFWRIDAEGPGGTVKGDVWTFKTAPGRATAPSPGNGDTAIALDAVLGWTAGSGAVSHDVYLGTDLTAVTNATPASAEFQINQAGTSFDPSSLAGNTTYYWRIDEVGSDGTTQGDVWSFTTAAGQTMEPISPANGETGVALMPTLTWTGGDGAVTQDIYLGLSATSLDFQGTNLAGNNSFTIGTILQGSTFYFWRVDSVTPDGTTTGDVWTFRTRATKASGPTPANFATDVAVDTLLSWTGDSEALSFEVYVGTAEANVAGSSAGALLPGVTLTTTTNTTIDPGTLAEQTIYYWRVDTVSGSGPTRTTGDVWRFTTEQLPPPQTANPTPADGATGVATTITLMWDLVVEADSYDVYLGTNQTAVATATNSGADPEFKGNRITNSILQTGLTLGTTYYWRIDTVNAAGTTTGIVWTFTTTP